MEKLSNFAQVDFTQTPRLVDGSRSGADSVGDPDVDDCSSDCCGPDLVYNGDVIREEIGRLVEGVTRSPSAASRSDNLDRVGAFHKTVEVCSGEMRGSGRRTRRRYRSRHLHFPGAGSARKDKDATSDTFEYARFDPSSDHCPGRAQLGSLLSTEYTVLFTCQVR